MSGLRSFSVNGSNGNGQRVGATIQATDKFAADKTAGRILSTPNSRGQATFARWNTSPQKGK